MQSFLAERLGTLQEIGIWDTKCNWLFLKDVTYKNNTRKDYNIMKKYKDGKGGLIFKERSEELLHAVLKNKGKQETRWVRADLRGKQAYFRNAPTLYDLLCTELRKYEANNDRAAKKKCKALIKSLKNGKHWALMIGYSQILEIYSGTSLDAQNASSLCTTVLKSVQEAIEKKRWEKTLSLRRKL